MREYAFFGLFAAKNTEACQVPVGVTRMGIKNDTGQMLRKLCEYKEIEIEKDGFLLTECCGKCDGFVINTMVLCQKHTIACFIGS